MGIKFLSIILTFAILCGAGFLARYKIIKHPVNFKKAFLLSLLITFVYYIVLSAIYYFILDIEEVAHLGVPDVIATGLNSWILTLKGNKDVKYVAKQSPKSKKKTIILVIVFLLVGAQILDICINTFGGHYIHVLSKSYTPESTVMKWYSYDSNEKFLYICMRSTGDVYRYRNVPKTVYQSFDAAESKGTAYSNFIKGKYGTGKFAIKYNWSDVFYVLITIFAIACLIIAFSLFNKRIKNIDFDKSSRSLPTSGSVFVHQVGSLNDYQIVHLHKAFMNETGRILKSVLPKEQVTPLLSLISEMTEKAMKEEYEKAKDQTNS